MVRGAVHGVIGHLQPHLRRSDGIEHGGCDSRGVFSSFQHLSTTPRICKPDPGEKACK